MILNAIAEKLKRQSKDDFKGRHFEAWLIVQAVAWCLRYPLSYRDLEEMFRERGFEVDHSTVNRWVLAYAPMIEKRLRQFRRCARLPRDLMRRTRKKRSLRPRIAHSRKNCVTYPIRGGRQSIEPS